ncbi:hypothetical protein AGOR_G00151580 [Albula goreensis]|uniref:FK506-binding protein-like n=1 Tax=Albula goreensis TaxID=1534307 RepID=A0A8T3D2P6_9TELE|nr:hypothetical protein AGOR_G00151580 [Albula goreensis]
MTLLLLGGSCVIPGVHLELNGFTSRIAALAFLPAMKTVSDFEEEGGDSIDDVTSWVSVCPGGLWAVRRKRTVDRGMGDETPKMGSLCRVKVWLRTGGTAVEGQCLPHTGEAEPEQADAPTLTQLLSHPRSQDTVLQVPLNTWVVLRLGEGQCDVIEGCVEGIRERERCELLVSALNGDSKPQPGQVSAQGCAESEQSGGQRPGTDTAKGQDQHPCSPLLYSVELHSFTPGRESWEMGAAEKWQWVQEHRERGGHRFREGDLWGAADCYSRALKLLITLRGERGDEAVGPKEEEEGNVPEGGGEGGGGAQSDPQTGACKTTPTARERDTVRAGLHANMALCQLKLCQPGHAQRSSKRATELDPASAKAWYRLGQACSRTGELGQARAALRKVLDLQPGSATALRGLREVGAKEKEQDTKLGHRLSKMFS